MRLSVLLLSLPLMFVSASLATEPALRRAADGAWLLHHDGRPFFAQGANVWGENAHLSALIAAGGNAVRTYRAEDTERLLADVSTAPLSVLAGFELGKPRHGFDYADAGAVAAQNERVLAAVRRWRDEPRILAWALGNEIELHAPTPQLRPQMWRELEKLARAVRALDPVRPVAVVLAGIDPGILREVERECPAVDLVCFNVYGPLPDLPRRLDSLGWTKPYFVTEFGSPGYWEVSKAEWGAEHEPTSTQKALAIRRGWTEGIRGDRARCLGGFVFFWQAKQEATATWFGLFLASGERTAAVDELARAWGGRIESPPCPEISAFTFADGRDAFAAGAEAWVLLEHAALGPVEFTWEVAPESRDRKVGGDAEAALPARPLVARRLNDDNWSVIVPEQSGHHRLFLTLRDGHGGAATANLPFRVR